MTEMDPKPGLKASAGSTSLNGVGEIAKSQHQQLLPDRSISLSDFFDVSPRRSKFGSRLLLTDPPVAASRGPSLAAVSAHNHPRGAAVGGICTAAASAVGFEGRGIGRRAQQVNNRGAARSSARELSSPPQCTAAAPSAWGVGVPHHGGPVREASVDG